MKTTAANDGGIKLARDTVIEPDEMLLLDSEDRAKISVVFRVYEERHEDNKIMLFGTPESGDREKYYELWQHFKNRGIQMQTGAVHGETVIILSKPKKERIWINIVLLLATFLTTTAVGSLFLYQVDIFAGIGEFFTGLPFSLSLLTVLGTHELGHYIASRLWGVRCSLPYFIPVPIPPLGTLGALIRQRDPIPNRRALFDIGAAGPLVGVFVAIAFVVIGASLGSYVPPSTGNGVIPQDGAMLYLNGPLLFEMIYEAVYVPTGDGFIHPVAFAGWVGLFLTMLNLIPVGQLDGGHVARAILGERARILSLIVPWLLIAWGLYAGYVLQQGGEIWLFWGFITLLFASRPHPPPANDSEPVGGSRKLLTVFIIIIFILCFPPIPFLVG